MPTALTNDIQADSTEDHRPRRRRKEQLQPPESNALDSIARALKDKEEYRSLLRFRGPQAQRTLNALQNSLLTDTVLCSDLWNHGVVALQRLSVRTGLLPSIYELRGVKKLGQEAASEGRFGEVYRGEYKGELVCIKMLRINKEQREKIKKCYAREAILWAQLSHENILPFYGVCTLDSKPCLISPWAENGNVIEYLKKNPRSDRLALVQDVTAGLRYLHELEIVHGDLKGANVLVDFQGIACLADLGLSSVSDSDVLHWTTQSAAVSTGGTVRWQAPEQVLGEVVRNTKQSDIYAWACTSLEIFTSEIPYAEITVIGQVYRLKEKGEMPCHPSRRTPAWAAAGLDDGIWSLLNDCWNFQPENRPAIQKLQTGIGCPRTRGSPRQTALGIDRTHAPATFFFFNVR